MMTAIHFLMHSYIYEKLILSWAQLGWMHAKWMCKGNDSSKYQNLSKHEHSQRTMSHKNSSFFYGNGAVTQSHMLSRWNDPHKQLLLKSFGKHLRPRHSLNVYCNEEKKGKTVNSYSFRSSAGKYSLSSNYLMHIRFN